MDKPLQITLNFTSSGRRMISRILSLVTVSLATAYLYFRIAIGNQTMGKNAFLVKESAYFDTNYAKPHFAIYAAYFILFCFYIGGYELLALIIYKIIMPRSNK